MSSIARKWQNRRIQSRGRRDLQRAIDRAGTPGMHAELIAIASRHEQTISR